MLNLFKKMLMISLCTLLIFGVTGCNKTSFISAKFFKPLNKDNEKVDDVEVMEFQNGVVLYKDKEHRSVPAEYREHSINPASSDVNFGPHNIQFAPSDVNPK